MRTTYALIFSLILLTISCTKEEEETNINSNETNTTSNPENTDTTEETIDKTWFNLLSVKTSHGEMIIYLYNKTPLHQANYIERANEGFFDNEVFNRVVRYFVLQGGCLDTSEIGDVVYPINPEIDSTLTHVYGAVGGGRYADDINPDRLTSGCQFYIVNDEKGEHGLDGDYTIFGQVIHGLDVLESLSRVKLEGLSDAPVNPVEIDMDTLRMTATTLSKNYNYTDLR